MAHDVYDWSQACDRTIGSGRIQVHEDGESTWSEGTVVARWGIVSVYSQGPGDPVSTYEVVIDQRLYVRTERRFRTPRGLAYKARSFVLEILRGRS